MDSPDTARAALLSLHRSWVEAAGGKVPGGGLEVSADLSYAGEGLSALCKGRVFGEFEELKGTSLDRP
jgi:UDP-N-acetylglucosamine/UDP-N-acetylgalactosamine diphosphorylase